MKVSELKVVLQRALDNLENFHEDDAVVMQSNTMFVKDSIFLGVSGFEGGYINLGDNFDVEENDQICPECRSDLDWDESGLNPSCKNCNWSYTH